jgi:hypothetical protein
MDSHTKILMWGTLGLLGLYVLSRGAKPVEETPREDSLEYLVPSFRRKVEELLRLMEDEGLRPVVWETYRSPERVKETVSRGTGTLESIHPLGLAVDILEREKRWNAPAAFWESLHRNALKLGLTRVKKKQANGKVAWDLPHVQAIPWSLTKQYQAAKTIAAREAMLAKHYG